MGKRYILWSNTPRICREMCEAKTYMKCEVTKAQGNKAILSHMLTSFWYVCVLAVCVEANMCRYHVNEAFPVPRCQPIMYAHPKNSYHLLNIYTSLVTPNKESCFIEKHLQRRLLSPTLMPTEILSNPPAHPSFIPSGPAWCATVPGYPEGKSRPDGQKQNDFLSLVTIHCR